MKFSRDWHCFLLQQGECSWPHLVGGLSIGQTAGMLRYTAIYGLQTSGRRQLRHFDGKCARMRMASCHITVVSPSDAVWHMCAACLLQWAVDRPRAPIGTSKGYRQKPFFASFYSNLLNSTFRCAHAMRHARGMCKPQATSEHDLRT